MFEWLVAMWLIALPGLLIFANLVRIEKRRKARNAAHAKWVRANRADFEKIGVFI